MASDPKNSSRENKSGQRLFPWPGLIEHYRRSVEAVAKRDARRKGARSDRQLRYLSEGGARSRGARPGAYQAGEQYQSGSDRGTEDWGLRDLRSTRRRADASFFAGRQRRKYHRVLGGLPGI